MVVLVKHMILAFTFLADVSDEEFIEAENVIACHLGLKGYLSSEFIRLLFESQKFWNRFQNP